MNKKLFLCLFFSLGINTLWMPSAFSGSYSNSFLFIENNVDDEYFITPQSLEPRFSGANKFTRYASNQRSLGYMGYTNTNISAGYNVDIWLENSPIDGPFVGNRCMNNDSNCPSDGIWPAKYIEKLGAYMINQRNVGGQSNYARPIFSNSSYNYFKDMSSGKSTLLSLRACQTKSNYNPNAGETCLSVGGSQIASHEFTITKLGHIQLLSTNALQEIFIDSNGIPNIGLGSEFCQTGTVNRRDGIICNLVQYKQNSTSNISGLRVGLKLNPTYINYNPGTSDVMFKGNANSTWYSYTRAASNPTTSYTNVFSNTNNGQLSVFLSQAFLKQLIDRNIDLTNSQDFFTFAFYNSTVPQSGYYEFTPSNKLIIKPRNYGISIIPADFNPNPKKTGKVGSDHPITFNYIVTTTGFRQANNITAQVIGDNQIINNQSYCIFSSSDNSLQVPFSAYLSFKTKSTGKTISNRASCDSKKISLNNALWTETPWDVPAQDQGSYYRTNLDLTFPMNEGPSYWSLEGDDWIGSVTGSGSVKVTATWTGPDVTQ
ncbi:fimbrial protein [Moellerella wisconsensis]|uniref:fimbrial protein n=1 Tax=Moellerella wisconsensis TaxID=158849 RepID=UPI001F4E8691|nr:fimbrial protein [Moellerella wisconsensis]UNH25490.1 fimbrial protein [Moellerella wisconsensis]